VAGGVRTQEVEPRRGEESRRAGEGSDLLTIAGTLLQDLPGGARPEIEFGQGASRRTIGPCSTDPSTDSDEIRVPAACPWAGLGVFIVGSQHVWLAAPRELGPRPGRAAWLGAVWPGDAGNQSQPVRWHPPASGTHIGLLSRTEEDIMGRIVVTEFISLDGVIEAPGGGEDYKYGGGPSRSTVVTRATSSSWTRR
jgi:hypothetical protein